MLKLGGTGAGEILDIDGVGVNRVEAQPASESVEGIALVHRDCAGAAAELLTHLDHGVELRPGDDIAPARILGRGQRGEAVQALAGPVNPLVLVIGFERFPRQPVGKVAIDFLR